MCECVSADERQSVSTWLSPEAAAGGGAGAAAGGAGAAGGGAGAAGVTTGTGIGAAAIGAGADVLSPAAAKAFLASLRTQH